MKKVFVSGGSGYIAMYCIKILLEKGYNVVTSVREESQIDLVKKSLLKDMKISSKRIQIVKFSSLTTSLCQKYNSTVILRGLRAVSDFEYEFQLAGMNRKLNEKIETIFLMSDVDNQVISSRLVKEIAHLKGDLKKFITKSVIKEIKNKVWNFLLN